MARFDDAAKEPVRSHDGYEFHVTVHPIGFTQGSFVYHDQEFDVMVRCKYKNGNETKLGDSARGSDLAPLITNLITRILDRLTSQP